MEEIRVWISRISSFDIVLLQRLQNDWLNPSSDEWWKKRENEAIFRAKTWVWGFYFPKVRSNSKLSSFFYEECYLNNHIIRFVSYMKCFFLLHDHTQNIEKMSIASSNLSHAIFLSSVVFTGKKKMTQMFNLQYIKNNRSKKICKQTRCLLLTFMKIFFLRIWHFLIHSSFISLEKKKKKISSNNCIGKSSFFFSSTLSNILLVV